MKIIAIDTNGSQISINQFFSSFEEFSNNQHLLEQTSRFLKAIIRHPTPDDIKYIAVETKQGVRGKVILQSQGKEFFTWHGKDFFT